MKKTTLTFIDILNHTLLSQKTRLIAINESNYRTFLFIFLVFTTVNVGFSQDDPCTALPLPLSPVGSCTYVVGDNTGATDSDLVNPNIDAPAGCEPISDNYNGADVWFYIDLGPTTTSLQIDLNHIAASTFNDGVVALYTGTCGGNLTIVECDDDSGDALWEANFSVLNALTPNTRVFVRVWDWGGNDEGTFDICASEVVDPCASITNIGACGTTPINATIDNRFGAFNDSTCEDVPGDEAVYSFTPTLTGNYTITQISSFDTINYLYQTSCAATGWTCIADLTGNNVTTNSFTLTAGTTYYIMLDSEDSSGGNVSFTINCPIPPPECGDPFYDSGGLSGDYANNELETTTITPTTAGDVVTVTFTSFDLESGWDFLDVYDGPDATYPYLGTFSGTGIPGPFTSSDPSGALTFVFDSDSSNTGAGWEANVTCGPYVPPTVCGSTFTDSGGAGTNYSNNELITTTLIPDIANTFVEATFTFFNTESCCDELFIYDGPDATYPLIGTFAGTPAVPFTITSSDPSGALTFVFDSDFSLTYGGYIADIECISIAPTCGDTFYDSGGASSNYANNENETTIISPINPGDAVTATFTSFDLSSGDTLEIFDGATSLGVFSGTSIPGPFTSTDPSGELSFLFISNGSGTSSGWSADITCNILCNISISETIYPIGADDCTLNYSELVATSPASPGGTSTIFSEDFNGTSIPTGWVTTNAAGGSWGISTSANAGGAANEAELSGGFNSSASGNVSLTSPAITISGQTNIQLDFVQFLNHFSSSYNYSISVQTNVDGAGWVNQYIVNPVTNDINQESRSIDLSALAGNSLLIRFNLNGFPFGLNYWYIDNVEITADTPPVIPQITWTPINGLYTDTALTTPYIAGAFTDTVYAAPNGTQIYTATDQNSCSITATVTYNKKVWDGTAGNIDWNTPTNWFPNGVPTATNCVYIVDTGGNDPVIDGTTDGLGLNLTIETNATLTIDDDTDTNYGTLTITDFIDLQGNSVLHILNNSSLVQINDGTVNSNNNTGTGTLIMVRETYVSGSDYVYWSSPVSNMSLSNIYGLDTPGATYQWIPTIPNGTYTLPPGPCIPNAIPFCHGDWQAYAGNMEIGTGYITNGPTSQGNTPTNYSTSIAGVIPNNGLITHTIVGGANVSTNCDFTHYPYGDPITVTPFDDNWNLVGNPYPSAISANAFIGYDDGTRDNNLIEGAIHIWTHGTDPNGVNPDSFYDDFIFNYNPNDYLTYNLSGTNTYPNEITATDYHIASGQGFFVLSWLDDTTGDITFSNTMRNVTHDNSNFYRANSQSQETSSDPERHRIWLNLSDQNNQTSSTMVGYIEGATQEKDRSYDAYTFENNTMSLYSLIDDEKMVIQGRQLPFEIEDQVPLGVEITIAGAYFISINGVDGLFTNGSQDIYLEDTYANTIHNLRSTPYTFSSEIGNFNDRFILRYTSNALSIDEVEILNGITVFEDQDNLIIKSQYEVLESVEVYDILGRSLFSNKAINSYHLQIASIKPKDQALFLKIRLANGQQKIEKIIF